MNASSGIRTYPGRRHRVSEPRKAERTQKNPGRRSAAFARRIAPGQLADWAEGPGAELPAWPRLPRRPAELGRGAADAAFLLDSASLKDRRALLRGSSGAEAAFSRRRPRQPTAQQIARARKRVFGPSSCCRLGRSGPETLGGGGDRRSAGCSAVWGHAGVGVISYGPLWASGDSDHAAEAP